MTPQEAVDRVTQAENLWVSELSPGNFQVISVDPLIPQAEVQRVFRVQINEIARAGWAVLIDREEVTETVLEWVALEELECARILNEISRREDATS